MYWKQMIEIWKVVDVPGFVAYPYLDYPFDDIDNQDKYLLHNSFNISYNIYHLFLSTKIIYVPSPSICFDFYKFPFFDNRSNYDRNDTFKYISNEYNHQLSLKLKNLVNSYSLHHDGISKNTLDPSEFSKSFRASINLSSQSYMSSRPCEFYAGLALMRLTRIEEEILSLGADNQIPCYDSNLAYSLNRSYLVVKKLDGRGMKRKDSFLLDIKILTERIPEILGGLLRANKLCMDTTPKLQELIEKLKELIKGSTEQIESIRQNVKEIISYILTIKNIIAFSEKKIDPGTYVSTNIKDFESIENRIKNTGEINNGISNLRMIDCDINSSFSYIEDSENSLKKLNNHVNELKNTNRRISELRVQVEDALSILKGVQGQIVYIRWTAGSITKRKYKEMDSEVTGKIEWFRVLVEELVTKNSNCIDRVRLLCIKFKYSCRIIDIRMEVIESCILSIGYRLYRTRWNLFTIRASNNYNIENSERSLRHIINPFLVCSLRSLIENLHKNDWSIKRIKEGGISSKNSIGQGQEGGFGSVRNEDYRELIWATISHIYMAELEFASGKIYECHRWMKRIEKVLEKVRCYCLFHFKFKEDPLYWNKLADYKNEGDHLNDFGGEIGMDDRNHVCICLVIRHRLYPMFMNCYYIVIEIIKDLSSTSSRKFEESKKSNTLEFYKTKLALFLIEIVGKLFVLIEEKCLTHFLITPYGSFHCFCIYPKDSYYSYFISIMIYISSLVEGIFDRQNKTIKDSIQSLSALKAEMEHIKCDKADRGSTTCYVHSTSISLWICGDQVNSTIYYTEGKCIFARNQIKGWDISKKICCSKQNDGTCCCPSCQAGSDNGSCQCPKPGGGTCNNNECKDQIIFKVKFTLNYSQGIGPIFESGYSVPNFWCMCKKNGCSQKVSSQTCGCNNTDCLRCGKGRMIQFYGKAIRACYKLVHQVGMNGIFYLMSEMKCDHDKVFRKMTETLKQENLVRITRNIRIVDSTNEISKNKFEGGSNNNYTCNDAYRINTSRAHGSLKYIIIKIVLILIIVVMTIFISETLVFIIYKSSIICQILNPSLYAIFPMEGRLSLIHQ